MLEKNNPLCIVGLGLIGGSYARALKRQGFTVWAVDRDPAAIEYALQNRLIDRGESGAAAVGLIAQARYIVLAVYPQGVLPWLDEHKNLLQDGTVITDVTGVKTAIVYRAQEALGDKAEFIASHPMAGRETSGVRSSDEAIFTQANFLITPTARNTDQGIDFARSLGRILGFAQISELTPEEHDEMIGFVSQLTHAIAVSLMNCCDNPQLSAYTGDSFRDLTRIAKINAPLWCELFFLNKEALTQEIDRFSQALEELRRKVAQEDREGLTALFEKSTRRRKRFDRAEE